ncbi:hypothetical protein COCCADRAFT_111053 [Bipolaris zeicola 26-R-13]|uniref:CCHC-type domain-containing protein n=1 Tax=Cochliobolus carbonum (strain 26-R-13) TaxID=930089 RepID=W6XQ48_COCC2|nr:uncharacterized protein COCCADRAFT_111053 [Bipolaris zeicola 26-R-13]EUC27678.1 hypothetical protein COCCADRAFT_111053 [Bipolaris zeicola 26-R-13]
MQELVELATRIDNRLWNGAQQKTRLQPTTANMKKHRNRTNKDGDTYMTDKVQNKVKNKKSQGTNQDNISKKERQKRYDNKACLRCGEMGHFRRGCPKNEVRQTVVMADMKIFRTSELEPIANTKDEVSDIAVYDETRLPGREPYVKLPQPIQMEEIGSWDDPQDVEGVLYEVGALQQLAQMQCWVCGDTKHLANDCTRLGRIGTTGYNTQNAIYQAPNQQRYLEEELPEAFDQGLPQKSTCTRHKHLHWVDCKQRKYSPTPCTNMTKQFSLNDHYDGNEYS